MKNFREVYDCNSITINVTNACDLSCRYCFEHEKNAATMSPSTAIKIVDESYNLVPKEQGKFTINIFGGEPLLNWETIKAVVDHCNEKKYEVSYGITTNLTHLTDEMIEYIDDNSIMLLVSIDGTKEVHDYNRCKSFDKVIKNIERLKENNLQMLMEARMTIMPDMVDKALDGVKYLYELGFNNICPMPVTDAKWDTDSLNKLQKHYDDIFDFYLSILNDENNKRNVSIKNTDEIITNVLSPDVEDGTMCPIGSTKWCAFDTNGDIYPCHQGPTSKEPFKKQMLIGNIYTMVDETKVKTYPNNHFEHCRCQGCEGKSICKGGCPTENLRETGIHNLPTVAYCNNMLALYRSAIKFREKIITASNIHNRRLNILKENLKLKKYLDEVLMQTQLNNEDKMELIMRVSHFQDMYNRLDGKIIPSFEQYFVEKLKIVCAYLYAERGEIYGESR